MVNRVIRQLLDFGNPELFQACNHKAGFLYQC